jgi:hypothetical protein
VFSDVGVPPSLCGFVFRDGHRKLEYSRELSWDSDPRLSIDFWPLNGFVSACANRLEDSSGWSSNLGGQAGLGRPSATASWFGERREAAGSDGWHSVVEPRAGGQSEQGERQVKKVIEGTEALKVSILWSMP